MAESQFMPAAPPGHSVDAAISGIESGQSMMQRASNLRQSKQMEEMRQQQMAEDVIMAPLKQAKQRADLATSLMSLESARRAQDMREKLAPVMLRAKEEFNSIMTLQDPQVRAEVGQEWIAMYGQLANVKEVEQEWKAYKDIIASNIVENNTLKNLKFTQEEMTKRTKMTQEGITERNKNTTRTWEQKTQEAITAAEESEDPELASELQAVYDRRKKRPDSEILDKPETTEIDGKKFYRSRKGGEWKPLSSESVADRVSTDVMSALGVPSFKTPEEAKAAKGKNEIKNGQTILVAGKRAKWED